MPNSDYSSAKPADTQPRPGWPGALLLAALTGLAGCTIAVPFTDGSAGIQPERGAESLIVSLTMTDYKPGWKSRRVFWRHVELVQESLSDQPGLVGYSLRRQIIGNRAWTMTVWQDEPSLQAFVRSPAHREAIRHAAPALENVRFARVQLPAHAIPIGWEQAEQLLAAREGGYQEVDR